MKRVMIVFGTRPEAIKMAPVVKAFKAESGVYETVVVVTGQHREMLDQVLEIFDIVPDYDLNIMQAGQDLYDVTSRVLTGMRSVLKEVQPDVVLVHGDTTTSTSAALAAFYAKIPVGHVEAGLRTGNIYSPWPEEMNRKITGQIATFHFSPTYESSENLKLEGVDAPNISITGNTVIDALKYVVERINTDIGLKERLSNGILSQGYDIAGAVSCGRRLVLITAHRRENFGDGIKNICRAIITLAQKYPDTDFVYPVHPNPNIRNAVLSEIEASGLDNIFVILPLDYPSFIFMVSNAALLLSDSGGVQEEATAIGKHVLVMRDKTERPEALKTGLVKLVGSDVDRIAEEASGILDRKDGFPDYSTSIISNPFGDGKAGARIVEFVGSRI